MGRTGKPALVAAALAVALVSCGTTESSEVAASDYVGWEQRGVSSLSDDDIEELLSGAGHGYALPAELNEHPGPAHVLDLATELHLAADQVAEVERIEAEMREQARELGGRLVDAEWSLDEAFRAGTDPNEVAELTRRSAVIEAELRAVHLEAHLDTTALLSATQIERYDELRGYTSENGTSDHGDHDGGHGGHGDH